MKEDKTPETKVNKDEMADMPEPKKSGDSKVWMTVAVIAILALIGLGIYGFISMRAMNTKIKDQQTQIDELSSSKKTLEDAASAAATAATEAAAKAVGNAVTSTATDKNQIIASSESYCSGASISNCKPSIAKQLTEYADVVLQDKKHLLLIKSTNNTWPVILVSEGSLCDVGTDGVAATAINKLCNR